MQDSSIIKVFDRNYRNTFSSIVLSVQLGSERTGLN
jgi:hypothetical protein